VGAVDIEALSPYWHWLAVAPAVDEFMGNRPVFGVVPVLTAARTEIAVQVTPTAPIEEREAASPTREDIVLLLFMLAIGKYCFGQTLSSIHTCFSYPQSKYFPHLH
jgi:hypothetical protein